jgi:hypothetical protein
MAWIRLPAWIAGIRSLSFSPAQSASAGSTNIGSPARQVEEPSVGRAASRRTRLTLTCALIGTGLVVGRGRDLRPGRGRDSKA